MKYPPDGSASVRSRRASSRHDRCKWTRTDHCPLEIARRAPPEPDWLCLREHHSLSDRGTAVLECGAAPESVAARVDQALTALALAFRPRFLYVGGGLTERPEVRACRPRLPDFTSLVWSRSGRFVGEVGGRIIGGPAAIVFAVGQCSIKVSCNGHRRVHDRPLREVPPGTCDLAGIEFIRRVVASELHTVSAGIAVVLAVPGDVSDDLTPGHCSYGWGDRTGLLRDLLPVDAVTDRPVWILNDAELAAESARAEINPSPGQRCLVVTFGFAPGGALLIPAGSSGSSRR